MNSRFRWWPALVVLAGVATGSYLYLTRAPQPMPLESGPSGPSDASSAGVIRHPIEEIAQDSLDDGTAQGELPPLDASDPAVEGAAADLIGGETIPGLLSPGDYVRKVVVTVDNLARDQTSARLWPVQPTPGRFTVRQEGDRSYLSAENFQRYSPFVSLATSVDTGKLVALYVRYYPLLQQAYAELGYPGQYFNDRVIEVIDNLLATPEPGDRTELVLLPQDPSVEVARPWVLYEYADPALRSLSAGQKILVRMGPENAGRVKTRLRELRKRLATAPGQASEQ